MGQPTFTADLAALLDHFAQTLVTTLGLAVAEIDLLRPDGTLEVASVVGDDQARATLLGGPVNHGRWQTYRPDDVLVAPLTGGDGTPLGTVSVVTTGGAHPFGTTTRDALLAFAVAAGMAIEHATLLARAELSEQMFRSQAMSDPLTGIGSRPLLLERLRHASTSRPESGGVMALAFVDLDNFKTVNDEHNHAMGDHVLRTVAERIQTAVRAHDTVARWGGDEFLVLLHPLASEHSALGAVQRILTAIAEPITDRGHTVNVTASIGVSFWTSDSQVEPGEMVRRADAAMYEVKRTRVNDFAVFDAFDAETSRRLHLLDLLSRAVAEQRVAVHYQPIVQVEDQRVVGVEALLRLRDDDGALVYPPELLDPGGPPSDVSHEVMMLASAQVAQWVDRGHDLWLSVNVCAQQVADIDGFTSNVAECLTASGLAPGRLMLELTEHALLSTTAHTLRGIDELVESGIRLSVDDFGTGYGSMTYVQVMPVHELKIDRSFVARAPAQHASSAIIRSIASLARDLDLGCVAEGVETSAQHELVRRAGVSLAQGRYYSDALDAGSLEKLLEEANRLAAESPTPATSCAWPENWDSTPPATTSHEASHQDGARSDPQKP